MKKRSVDILGHQTSVTLEEEFWAALKTIAERRGLPVRGLIAEIDGTRDKNQNLSSEIRLYVLRDLQSRLA